MALSSRAGKLGLKSRLIEASKLRPEWFKDPQVSTEPRVLTEQTHRYFNVLYVGGHGHPSDDPFPVILANLLSGKRLTLLDAQDDSVLSSGNTLLGELRKRKDKLQLSGKTIADLQQKIAVLSFRQSAYGIGGLISYRRGVRELRKKGTSVKSIKLHPGLAWNTGFKPRAFHLIVDRGTLNFAATYLFSSAPSVDRHEATVNHYLELLPEGGQIKFLVHGTNRGKPESMSDGILEKFLRNLIEQGKIHVREVNLRPVQPEEDGYDFYENSFYKYPRALVVTKLRQGSASRAD